jgi:protein disulfide-isomerase A1
MLEPVWEELGKTNLNSGDNIVIAKMDATLNDIPPGLKYDISGFPTITLFKADTNEIKELNSGRRTLPDFLAFLKDNINNGGGVRALEDL